MNLSQVLEWLTFVIGIAAISFVSCFFARHWAIAFKVIDQPIGGRKIHQRPVPLWGGIGVGLAIILMMIFQALVRGEFYWDFTDPFVIQLVGFIGGVGVLMLGGALDDKFNLKPQFQFLFHAAACLILVLTGTHIVHITNWVGGPPVELGIYGYILAFLWLLGATYAMKFMDGLDGLVTGQTVIGAFLIGCLGLTAKYYQPAVSDVAFEIAACFLGFLPFNFYPAKQFLGESGATLAGFSLGFLSVLGGAKLATGLMALSFPLMDAAFVVIGRLARGVPFWKGDNTHLHFKLLRAGLTQRQIVFLIWTISLVTGIFALELQSVGKAILVLCLFLVVLGLSAWAGSRARHSL
jgi:UDP-GlcNAc:undecaprenyl-phosphate GlcNAc-1-phosphate transferase